MKTLAPFTLLFSLFTCVVQAQFNYGVASGDPLQDRVIIWSHFTPADSTSDTDVSWKMARDMDFSNLVASGTARSTAENSFTVKVDVTGLQPNTWYYYQFEANGHQSMVGRTKTLPANPSADIRFGHITCTNYHDGYFNALGRLADRNDLEFIVHCGDFIYESSGDNGLPDRPTFPPVRIYTLEEYRLRYAHYMKDPDMQRLRQLYPMILVWDDHEVSDDATKFDSPDHDPDRGPYEDRRQVAFKTYHEWQPIRTPDVQDLSKIWRQFRIGDLAQFNMLDSRHYGRDPIADASEGFTLFATETEDTSRTMLGFDQEAWLHNNLRQNADATWTVFVQQVMFSPWNIGGLPESVLQQTPLRNVVRSGGNALNPDQWDGYTATRNRIYEVLEEMDKDNLVVLSGDVHTSFALDIAEDPYNPLIYDPITGRGSYGVEFVTPAASSSGLDDIPEEAVQALEVADLLANPHMRFNELRSQGYTVHQMTANHWQGDFYFVETVESRNANQEFVVAYRTNKDADHLVQQQDRITDDNRNPPAPETTTSIAQSNKQYGLTISPNPFDQEIRLAGDGVLEFTLLDSKGAVVKTARVNQSGKVSTADVKPGYYVGQVHFGNGGFRAFHMVKTQ